METQEQQRKSPAALAALGGALLWLAALALTDQAHALTGAPVLNIIAFLVFGGSGLGCYVPLVCEYVGYYTIPKMRNVLVTIALLLLGGAVGFRISDWIIPGDPATLVRPARKVIAGIPVQNGRQVVINVYFNNVGHRLAKEVVWGSAYVVVATPDAVAAEKQMLDEQYDRMVMRRTRPELAPGEDVYMTHYIDLSPADVEAIHNFDKRIYVLSRVTWTDATGDHEYERCSFQSGTNTAWGTCLSHNTID